MAGVHIVGVVAPQVGSQVPCLAVLVGIENNPSVGRVLNVAGVYDARLVFGLAVALHGDVTAGGLDGEVAGKGALLFGEEPQGYIGGLVEGGAHHVVFGHDAIEGCRTGNFIDEEVLRAGVLKLYSGCGVALR